MLLSRTIIDELFGAATNIKVVILKRSKASLIPTDNYMFKVSNRNTRTSSEICSKLTTKGPERRYWHRSAVFFVNFEHISHLVLVFLLSTLSSKMPAGISGSQIDFFY